MAHGLVLRGVWKRRVLGVTTPMLSPRSESEKAMSRMLPGRGKGGGRAAGRVVVVLPRETKFPGRSAGPQMSSCPTWRPPKQPNVKKNDPPPPLPPPPQDFRVVEILRDLGCSHELLTRLQERLAVTPPSAAPPLIPGSQAKRLADLQALLARAFFSSHGFKGAT